MRDERTNAPKTTEWLYAHSAVIAYNALRNVSALQPDDYAKRFPLAPAVFVRPHRLFNVGDFVFVDLYQNGQAKRHPVAGYSTKKQCAIPRCVRKREGNRAWYKWGEGIYVQHTRWHYRDESGSGTQDSSRAPLRILIDPDDLVNRSPNDPDVRSRAIISASRVCTSSPAPSRAHAL